MSTASVSCWHVYVTSLWSASLDFVLEGPVWGRATRRSGTTCNLVSMHIDDVAATSRGLLREKWMETSDADGSLPCSKGDRFHTSFKAKHALKLVKNDRVLMLDIDLGTGEYRDESIELPELAATKQFFAGQKRGMKMKDRHLCVVLLVGQACWEASPGKDDDVVDHSSESHNIVFRVVGVIMESVRSYRNDREKKGHARKDCSKFSAWLVGCKRRMLE